MRGLQISRWSVLCLATVIWPVFSCVVTEEGPSQHKLLGGARGVVRSAVGYPLEGIMVQLIARSNSIRTTVYSNEEGRYEFPKLATGVYTLRIALPLQFRPYQKDSVRIDGATQLEEIVLERVTDSDLLPPTPEIAAQLTGAEWLMNLPGTGEEKRTFTVSCNWCHSYQQVFRTRYDEHGWRLIMDRMTHYAGSPIINRNSRGRLSPEKEEMLVQWLARVRGPDSEDPPFRVLPGPRGLATRVIVTEYELPRVMLATHDVAGDSNGNLWYSPHRSPYIGKLDPLTGIVKEYRVPLTPGALPGTHWITVDKNDNVWMSENWAHKLTKFDPRTEKFTQIEPPPRLNPDGTPRPLNTSMGGNWVLDPEGYIWKARSSMVVKVSPETGEYLEQYPLQKVSGTYGSAMSADGNFFAGGGWPADVVVALNRETGEVIELETRYPNAGPARGAFDPDGNAWFGGRGGVLVKIDPKARRLSEYTASNPYISFYEANADKNGEIWASELHGGRYVRFNPRTERWIEYVLPEPFAHNRKSWIDNSTDPVTVWYVDHNSYLVRIQPLE